MIADRNVRQVEGNMTGQRIAMSIDPTATAHIMNVLTDLYSDPEAAVIREYSTNGLDAHVEAGVSRPIEVQTPTPLSPFIKIRDYGIGLTVDDIHSIYSQYGASTKRGTNDQTGMLGLGCKSALTYADQFTLTSVKDGTKVVVIVGRDEEGAGTMTVVDTRSTDEPNGTEVMVPAKRGNAIKSKAETFFSTWPEGSVLLDGETPKRFDGLRLSDDLYIIEGGQSKVVMGGVTYPAKIDTGTNVALLAFVPIGSVNFPPPRESLMDTAKTRETLSQVAKDYHRLVGSAIQNEVDASATPQDAIRVVTHWQQYVPGKARPSDYTYRGKTIPVSYTADIPVPDTDEDGFYVEDPKTMQEYIIRSSYYYRRAASDTTTVPVAEWPNILWIRDFAPKKLNKQHKDKALKWCAENGIDTEHVTKLVSDPTSGPVSDFIDPSYILDWANVRKVQLQPRAKPGHKPRIPGSFDCWVSGKHTTGVAGDSLDQTRPIFWIHGNIWQGSRYDDALCALYPKGFTLVCLPENRIAKFCRLLPNAKQARKGIEEAQQAWMRGLSDDQRLALAAHDTMARDGSRNLLASLDVTRVDDPALREAHGLAKRNVAELVARRDSASRFVTPSNPTKWENPIRDYPLIAGRTSACDHTYLYLNAAYAAAQEAAA